MKAGIVQALFALEAFANRRHRCASALVFLWTSDEEIGSEASRRIFEAEARRSDAVFVLEPSFGPQGLLKTARKGVGEAEIIVHGRASHAGLAPQEGINAIHEMARQIARIEKWNDLRRGVTINVGIIEGGTRSQCHSRTRPRCSRPARLARFRHAQPRSAVCTSCALRNWRSSGNSPAASTALRSKAK